jgi:hypothetical protein
MVHDADTEALSATHVPSNQDQYRVRSKLKGRPIRALQGAICFVFLVWNITATNITKTESWSHRLRPVHLVDESNCGMVVSVVKLFNYKLCIDI